MQKLMVVGGSGVLGNLICRELIRIFDDTIRLIVSDYKIDRGKETAISLGKDVGFHFLDVNNYKSIEQAIHNVDVVIIALKQSNPDIQKVCIENKVLCIDVTVFSDFVNKVRLLNEAAINYNIGSFVMSGLIPGLSGLMIKKAISNFNEISEVNIGFLQNTNAKAGLTGILDMLSLVNQDVYILNDSKKVPGFTEKRMVDFLSPFNTREVRRIEHPEQSFLEMKLQLKNLKYWTAWNSNAFNAFVSLIKRLNMIDFVLKSKRKNVLSKFVKHNSNKPEPVFLTVEVQGIAENKKCVKTFTLSTFSDYHTTAMVTAALAKIASEKKVTGVLFLFEITDFDEILSIIDCDKISWEETVKYY